MFRSEAALYPLKTLDLSEMDALVIAPHPDDESIGCGGCIAKHVKAGRKVKIIFLTDGGKGDFNGIYGRDYLQLRRQSTCNAMEALGVEDFVFWAYGDRELYYVIDQIEERLFQTMNTSHAESLVYVPSPFEAHPDHRASFIALWKLRKRLPISIAAYEVLIPLYPNILVDITDVVQYKKKAIESYYTELYYNDYLSKILGLNRFRTAVLPKESLYAEALIYINKNENYNKGFVFDILNAALLY